LPIVRLQIMPYSAIMAIIKKTDSPPEQTELSINNGDLQALNEVLEKFGFADEQAALRYALFALLKAEKNVLYVDQGEKIVRLAPTNTIVQKQDEEK